jgi:catechol 2,3-dioxygenase-like lactoylglutathione lyase family enzyme
MSIKSLAHVCIKTTDLDATAKFYCGALGMTKFFDFTRRGEVIGFYMKATNETFVEVFLADEVQKIDKQVLGHFCLETASLKDLRAKLTAEGYTPGEITMGADHTPQFWMKDPNGMDLEFQEYTEQSAQITGQPVEVNW